MKTELARDKQKNAKTRPNRKIRQKQAKETKRQKDKKTKMKIGTILCEMKNTVIILNLLDYINDSPFLRNMHVLYYFYISKEVGVTQR